MSKKVKDIIIPKLRFTHPDGKVFPNWDEVELNVLAKLETKKNKNDDINRVLTNSASDGIVDQRDYFDKDIANKNNLEGYYIVDKGDYVYNPRVSNIAPVGPVSKNKIGKGLMSPLYTVFRFNSLDNDFYEHYFKTTHWHQYLRKVSNSGARFDRMSITPTVFMEMRVPYPKPEEQQKIAACLSSLDDLILAESKKLNAYKAHKKALMQQLFPTEGETVPKLRFAEFMDDEGWNIKMLGEIAQNLDNKRVPITSNEREKGNIPYYGASGVIDYVKEFIFDDDLLCISEDGANLMDRTYPIAFSISGKTWVNNHAHVLKFENDFTQVIVENYLNAINLEDFLTGMAQPKLNRAKLDQIPIPLAKDEKEQQKIAACLSSLDELITAKAEKNEALKEHKKGLMQALFPDVNTVKE